MEEFRLLSVKEEELLSIEEKRKYYTELKEYLKTRKLTNITPGATIIGPKLKGITNKLATGVTKLFSSKNVEWISDGHENIPDKTVIFAHTHQGILDGFVWIPNLDRHCLILHGADVNKALLFCQLNTGLILVKKSMPGVDSNDKTKQVKEYNKNAKLDMIELLLQGHSISYFPEGTWNLSPNKLHLPINNGFLDIAKKAEVPIIPVVHEFTYDSSTDKEVITKIHTRYGKPIIIGLEDNIANKLKEYDEAISSIRWDLIEEKGVFNRQQINNQQYINFLKGNYKNLKLGKLDIPKERANIYGAGDEFYKFNFVNDVFFDDEGNLLETDEVIKLRELNKKHNI